MTDITLPREQWNLIDPHGAIRATEDTCIKSWARIDGYKPTVEGLLGYEQQGWRVEPAQPAPEPWAWATFDGEGGYDFRLYEGNESYREEYLKRNGPQYRSWVMPLYATQAQTAPKDHEVRELVNALRDVAVQHHASPQLRERIAGLIRPWAAGTQSATPASAPVGDDGAQPAGEEAHPDIAKLRSAVNLALTYFGMDEDESNREVFKALREAYAHAASLPEHIDRIATVFGSLRKMAEALDIDVGYLSRLRSGEKADPSDEILATLGLRRTVTYTKVRTGPYEATPLIPRTRPA